MKQLERLSLIIGNENIKKLNKTTVLILGLGGVGSFALESIVRCGIGKVIIVDKDVIDITNLNRQLMTNHDNIGRYKTDVWEERIKKINPSCNVIKITDFINSNNIELIFKEKIDYVIDACDSIATKKELIRQCVKRKIKFISSMGMGNKLDPTKIKIIDVRKTSYDPIAKVIRKMVKDEKIKEKVMVVCSDEKPINNKGKVIGSTTFVPGVAGLFCASYVINDIIKKDCDNNEK
ncbi:MAG: tRNA threonylcarbamoyladenosine dehydratase [Mollicutes bacterium]|nr:tRNA threonylcarbamoyladenosine dehydratase [Mollicutes bacterium]